MERAHVKKVQTNRKFFQKYPKKHEKRSNSCLHLLRLRDGATSTQRATIRQLLNTIPVFDSFTIKIPYDDKYVKDKACVLNYYTLQTDKTNMKPSPYKLVGKRVCETMPKEKYKLGLYFPQLHLESRPPNKKGRQRTFWFVCQGSAPKMVYGSSFFEVVESDLPVLCKKIREAFLETGFEIPLPIIEQAVLSKIDFCKNIRFMGGEKIEDIIEKLSKFNDKKRAAFGKTQYGGTTFDQWNYFQPSKNLRFYNKVKEIRDTGFTSVERSLVGTNYAVLRVEVSTHDKRSAQCLMSRSLTELGRPAKKQYTLADVFDKDIARQALLNEVGMAIDLKKARMFSYTTMSSYDQMVFLRKFLSSLQAYKVHYHMSRVREVGLKRAHDEIMQPRNTTNYRLWNDLQQAVALLPEPKTRAFNLTKKLLSDLESFVLVPGVHV